MAKKHRRKQQNVFLIILLLPRGLEPRTLRLLAVRSDQLSYKSFRLFTKSRRVMPIEVPAGWRRQKMENLGIDPSASRMLSERSTI